MGKVEVLPNHQWGADAALHSAIEELKPTDKVLIIGLKEHESGEVTRVFRSANLTVGELVFEMERRKMEVLLGNDD